MLPGSIVSGYSPIRSEIDPMPLMRKLAEEGAKLALPCVTARGQSLIFRLFLVGYFGRSAGVWEWHLRAYAGWLIFGTIVVWLWSWTIARGMLRVTSAGVVGAWYFRR